MNTRPHSVSVTLAMIGLHALFWLVFGLIVTLDLHPALSDLQLFYKAILAIASLAAAGVLSVLFFCLRQPGRRLAYFIALAFFTLAALATIFDDIGLSDLLFLSANLMTMFLLVRDRGWYC